MVLQTPVTSIIVTRNGINVRLAMLPPRYRRLGAMRGVGVGRLDKAERSLLSGPADKDQLIS